MVTEFLVVTALLFLLLANGSPVAFAMLFCGFVGIWWVLGDAPATGVLSGAPYASVSSYTLSTLPMFILMGEFLTSGRFTRDLFNASHKWLGHFRGGLAYAAISGGALLAAVTGSSTAAASTLARAAFPEMKRYGYQETFITGVLATVGTLAILIPPSIALIIYGILTDTPVGALLLSGIVPGLLTALGYVIAIKLRVTLTPDAAPTAPERAALRERLASLITVWPVAVLIVAMFGAIYTGVITVTEVGAVGALTAFLIALVMGRMSLRAIAESFTNAAYSSAMILSIIAGAAVFGIFITVSQVPQQLIAYVEAAGFDPYIVLFIVIAALLVLGFFLDQLAVLILTLPIIFPLLTGVGFDPVWLGVIVIKTVEIGLVTPPMGLNCFVVSSVTKVPVHVVFRGIWLFIAVDLAILGVLIAFPDLILAIPRWAGMY